MAHKAISLKSAILSVSWFASLVASQANAGDSGPRAADAFTWVQPADTEILGQYGHVPEVLPSPSMTGVGGWEDAMDRARDFVAELTLEEKSMMVTGQPGPCVGNILPIPRLNFTGLCLQDGPSSVRQSDFASVFPAGVTTVSSWDRELIYKRFRAMGREYRAKGSHIALAPVAGAMSRSPYGGRNWEGFSPDPYLTGVAMEEGIMGIQDAGVQATAKHWLFNEQEILRNPEYYPNGTVRYESISSNVDDRTTHELYMWPFANAIRAGASSVMCSYNRVNGSYACQNSKLLNGLLKEELGFQGYVMTDWEGLHSGVASIESGTDMDMPGGIPNAKPLPDNSGLECYFGGNITVAVNNGTLPTDRLDDMITRIMTPYYFLRQDENFPSFDPAMAELNRQWVLEDYLWDWDMSGERSRDVRENHGELIRELAASSTILVKNENALPLKAPKSIAIFGNDAGDTTEGPMIRGNFEYGTLAIGGGSGNGRMTYLVTPLDAIRTRAKEDGSLVQHWLNNAVIKDSDVRDMWGPTAPEVCLVFVKARATEQMDREYLKFDWDGEEMVYSVARHCSNTIVVTHSGGVNILDFADHPNVTAIVVAHYPGQESGNSLTDVLYGKVNPSGRLPYTIPYNASDYITPVTTNISTMGVEDWQSWFEEGLEIDYRYFDAHNISVRYPFGFGLSYTEFELSNMKVEQVGKEITSAPEDRDTLPGGNPALWETLYKVQVTVHNTGDVTGSTVPQLYVAYPDSAPEGTPPLQLRGFDKLELAPGERRRVSFDLQRRDLSYWDVVAQQWLIPEGRFTLRAGFSSRDLVESATITPCQA